MTKTGRLELGTARSRTVFGAASHAAARGQPDFRELRGLKRSLALCGSLMAYSLIASATTQVPIDRTIVQIGSYTSGAYIVFSPAYSDSEGCSYTSWNQVYVDWSSNAGAKSLYATALAAFQARQQVGFGLEGCSSTGLPVVYRVDVRAP